METSSEADKIRRDKILAVSQSYGAQRGECTDSKGLKKKQTGKKYPVLLPVIHRAPGNTTCFCVSVYVREPFIPRTYA